MRLTLRTLLAYLDNVLEPADAEALRKKIEESEFAAGLVSRIKNVITKARMNAPKVEAKGLAEDANNVADYLDSTLTPERVGDFERYCLEGDVHLAEVAACHHILTLVLGKPADVSTGLRERIYGLPSAPTPEPKSTVTPVEQAVAEAAASNGHETLAPAVSAAVSASSANTDLPTGEAVPKPATAAIPAAEVPDYLRAAQPRRSFWPIAITAIAALVLLVLGLRAMGPLDKTHPLFGGGKPVAEVVPPSNGEVPADPVLKVDENGDQPTDAGDGSATVPGAEVVPGDVSAVPGDALPIVSIPGEEPAEMPAENPGANPGAPAPAEPGDMPAENPATTLPADPGSGTPAPEEPVIPGVTEPAPEIPGEPVPAAGEKDLGRFLSDTQILARQDPETLLWYRTPPRTVLQAGDRVASLPTYRPQVALASGVQLTFAGEGALTLVPPMEAGNSRVAIEYGRFLAVTNGAMGAKLEVITAGARGVLTLSDADAVASIEVRPYLAPGTDPEVGPVILVVDVFASSGRVVWQIEGAEPIEIPPHHVVTDLGNGEVEQNGPFENPAWVDASSTSELDRLNADLLERLIPGDKPLDVSLKELTSHRRIEVQSLAGRSLASMGSFESILRMLGDERHHSFWAGEVETLRQSLARSKDSAVLLRQAIVATMPAIATEVDRLLWGYSREQLVAGDAAVMVKLLESDAMEVRVITLDNLRTITGAMHLYMPQKKADGNRLAIQKWKERLEGGAIDYRTPPSPLFPYEPLKGVDPKGLPAKPAGAKS